VRLCVYFKKDFIRPPHLRYFPIPLRAVAIDVEEKFKHRGAQRSTEGEENVSTASVMVLLKKAAHTERSEVQILAESES